MSSKFKSKGKDSFINSLAHKASVDADDDTLAAKCKFNFAYFDVQPAGQSFEDWTKDNLSSLLNKLKEYSKQSLMYWIAQDVLSIYGGFPKKSDFTHPKHVPHQAQWATFRVEQAVRLAGFTLPGELDGKVQHSTKHLFDSNTFYVVFLDQNHRFYITNR